MTEEQASLVGRTFRHFKMRLSPTAIRLADERSKELLHGKSRKSPRNLYRLAGFAKDSETLEEMAVYCALYGERGLWVRSASCDRFAAQSLRSFGQHDACGAGESAKMFFETVERAGKTMKCFEVMEDQE